MRGKELATTVDVSFNTGIDPELFWVYAQARPGKSLEALRAGVAAEIARIRDRPPDEHELRKAKNLLQADYVRGLKTVSGKANQLGFYETVYGDYAEMFREVGRWEAVGAADIQRIARTYLVEDDATTVELVPTGKPARGAGGGGEAAPTGVVRRDGR